MYCLKVSDNSRISLTSIGLPLRPMLIKGTSFQADLAAYVFTVSEV